MRLFVGELDRLALGADDLFRCAARADGFGESNGLVGACLVWRNDRED